MTIPRWNILAYKRSGQKTPALEQRDEERKIRAEITRLEAEAHELEREFAAARAAAMSAPVEEISFATPPKTVRRSLTQTAKRSVPEKFRHEDHGTGFDGS